MSPKTPPKGHVVARFYKKTPRLLTEVLESMGVSVVRRSLPCQLWQVDRLPDPVMTQHLNIRHWSPTVAHITVNAPIEDYNGTWVDQGILLYTD